MKDYEVINNCLLCGGSISSIVNLGQTPLANEFLLYKTTQDMFSLNIMKCDGCNHVQLDTIVDKDRLFRNYLYVASTSKVNVEHFKQYANSVISQFELKENDIVCDIASNDGCFLKNFIDNNIKVIGIDPAQNIAAQANKNGILTIPEFFSKELANDIVDKYGSIKVITCNNMLAHNKDITTIVEGVGILLHHNGSFIFENSYLLDICDKSLFDLFYHEHIHHFHITPLISFFKKYCMDIYKVERLPNHGGSIRVYVCFSGVRFIDSSVNDLVELEKNINTELIELNNNIIKIGYELREKLQEIKSQGKTIAIYGTPAKATTLMYALNIDEKMIDFAVEDAPLKQGTFTPGKHVPIFHPNELLSRKPDYVLVLAWNFAQSIIKNHPEVAEYGGKWIVPIPELKVI
jgi:hypothetical protein